MVYCISTLDSFNRLKVRKVIGKTQKWTLWCKRIRRCTVKAWKLPTTSHSWKGQRTSDGGSRNYSVSLPIILLKIKVDQMLPSSYISSLLVSILWFCIWFPISINVRLYFGAAKMVTFCIIHIENKKIFLPPPPPPRVPTNPFARKCVFIFYIIYVKS